MRVEWGKKEDRIEVVRSREREETETCSDGRRKRVKRVMMEGRRQNGRNGYGLQDDALEWRERERRGDR